MKSTLNIGKGSEYESNLRAVSAEDTIKEREILLRGGREETWGELLWEIIHFKSVMSFVVWLIIIGGLMIISFQLYELWRHTAFLKTL